MCSAPLFGRDNVQEAAAPLGIQELAEFLGATRESVNKTLNDWRGRDIIAIRRGGLHIDNPGALRHVADAEDD